MNRSASPSSNQAWGSPELLLGLASLLCLWLPLALLQQVDALLAYLPWKRLLADTALLVLLLTAAIMAWWFLFLLLIKVSGQQHRPGKPANLLITGLYLLPFAFLCCWQIAFSGRHWVELMLDARLAPAPWLRILILVGGPLIVLLVLWRLGPARVFRSLLSAGQNMTGLVMVLVVGSLIGVLLYPPRLAPLVRTPEGQLPTPPADKTVSGQPDIILITIDSLAAKDAAPCADGATLMPELRKLARQANCFTRFYAASNFTTPTTSSIETGTLPWRHRAVQIGASVQEGASATALAQSLHDVGYTTASISANLLASPRHHGTYGGYDVEEIAKSKSLKTTVREWFTLFKDSSLPFLVYSATSFLGTMDIYVNRSENPYDPMKVYQRGVDVLLAAQAAAHPTQPAFMWLHTLPPHAPYLPTAAFKYRLLPAGQLDTWPQFLADNLTYQPALQGAVDRHHLRYQESIMGADQALGWLFEQLRAQGRWDKAVIVVSADHGESFEKGYMGHAGTDLHEALINIPLIIKLPGQKSGQVIDQVVSQADLAPTLIELGRGRISPSFEGRSIADTLQGRPQNPVPAFAMSLERSSRFEPLKDGHVAIVNGAWKLIYDIGRQTGRLYDLDKDPGETQDLYKARPEQTQMLTALLQGKLQAINLLPYPSR